MLAALRALRDAYAVGTNLMPDRIGDQMAGSDPKRRGVFGRNAQNTGHCRASGERVEPTPCALQNLPGERAGSARKRIFG